MLETALTLMSSTVTDYLKTGNQPKRRGNLANSRSPGAGNFPCLTGMISLGVNEERHFHNLAKALNREDWLLDPRYADRRQRQAHVDQFICELEAELIKYDAPDAEVILQKNGVPAARVRTMKECLLNRLNSVALFTAIPRRVLKRRAFRFGLTATFTILFSTAPR